MHLTQLNLPLTPIIEALNEGIIKQRKREERKWVDKQLEDTDVEELQLSWKMPPSNNVF